MKLFFKSLDFKSSNPNAILITRRKAPIPNKILTLMMANEHLYHKYLFNLRFTDILLIKETIQSHLLNARYTELRSRNFINLLIQEIINLICNRTQMVHSIHKSFNGIIF